MRIAPIPTSLVVVALVVVALIGGLMVGAPAQAAPATGPCGSTLSPADAARIAALSDVGDASPDAAHNTLPTLIDHVERLEAIADLLVERRDRRGLFAVGLAATERSAVLPIETAPGALRDPAWAHLLSLRLLDRFLAAVHAEFTGRPVPRHWQRYFDAAQQCSMSGEHAALLGYNAHITVDLAHAVDDATTTRANTVDYYRIVDAIASHGDAIVTATRRAYGVDLGPTFSFYFLGEGLDRIVGAGRATQPMLRAADVGYNVLTFENGLALQNPATRSTALAAIDALWSTGDTAITAADDIGLI